MSKEKKKAAVDEEWWIRRNARRRAKYALDASFRKRVNAQNRAEYKESNGVRKNAALPISSLSDCGNKRNVVGSDGKTSLRVTLSIAEMAHALGGYHTVVLYRWIRTDRFPAPSTMVEEKGLAPYAVYSLEDAKKLVAVMAWHQSQKAYFHARDIETIQRLFSSIGETPPTS